MRICDICKTNSAGCQSYVAIDERGNYAKLELCGICNRKLVDKQRHYEHLAYKETVEEVTGNPPKKKSWWNIFKR